MNTKKLDSRLYLKPAELEYLQLELNNKSSFLARDILRKVDKLLINLTHTAQKQPAIQKTALSLEQQLMELGSGSIESQHQFNNDQLRQGTILAAALEDTASNEDKEWYFQTTGIKL